MTRALVFMLALWAASILTLAASAAQPPTKTVERLAFAREAKAMRGTTDTLSTVKCRPSGRAYIYLCDFTGRHAGAKVCAATYVHYKPGNTGRYTVNIWGESWACGVLPPAAPPAYPGDGAPPA